MTPVVGADPVLGALKTSHPGLTGILGPIVGIKERTHKYIVFCNAGVAALAKKGHEDKLVSEVTALLMLDEKGCSTVRVLNHLRTFYIGGQKNLTCQGYIMEDASGLHSKEENKSFQRRLFDMDIPSKVQAWRCLRTIMEFSEQFTIGDLQLMLLNDGTIKVLDPLGIKEGKSEFNQKFIIEMINRLIDIGLRPDNNEPDKRDKAV